MNITSKTSRPRLIKNAFVVDPTQKLEDLRDILIEDGLIRAIDKPGSLDNLADQLNAEKTDVFDKLVIPGCVDLNVEVHQPSSAPLETYETASKAASRGGVTTIAQMPVTQPVCDNAYVVELALRKAKEAAKVRVCLIGALTKDRAGEMLAEIGLMKEAGIVAVSDYGRTLTNTYLMKKAMEYVGAFQIPIFAFARDVALAGKGVMQEGINSTKLGLRGEPSSSEEIIVQRDLVLLKYANCHLHFNSITTKGSLDAIKMAREAGFNVTVDTNPHYFSLNSDSIATYNANYKVVPPLRSKIEQENVIEALSDGTIDAIASNHIPLSFSDKDAVFEYAEPGIIGLETMLLLSLQLVQKKKISLSRMVALLSSNPAKVLNKAKIGSLKKGSFADFVVIDREQEFEYRKNEICSSGKNSPFVGQKFKGKIMMTFVHGSLIYEG